MVVLQQAERAARALVDAPFLLAAATLPTLVGGLQAVGQLLHPVAYAAAGAVTFFVSPFLVAGLLGSAGDALDGQTPSWSGWLAWGRERYVALLLANLGFLAVVLALSIAFGVVTFVVVILGAGIGLDGTGAATVGVVTLLAVLLFLAFVVGIALLFAYFSAAAVVGEEGPVDAIRGSVRLAVDYPTTTLGYVTLNGLASVVLGLPVYVVTFQYVELPPDAPTLGLQSLSPPLLLALAAFGLVTSAIATAFGSTLLVGVYRALCDRATAAEPLDPE